MLKRVPYLFGGTPYTKQGATLIVEVRTIHKIFVLASLRMVPKGQLGVGSALEFGKPIRRGGHPPKTTVQLV